MNSDDEDVSLPTDTLNILKQFLQEKEDREKLELEFTSLADNNKKVNFEENWQLSQFWYNETTKTKLSQVCKKLVNTNNFTIGLFSCPSLYFHIKNVHSNVKIFEFDKRFSAYGTDFFFYDYNNVEDDNLNEFKNYFDLIIVDPPFLSEECILKVSEIIKKLTKETSKIILCSGDVVAKWAEKYLGLEKSKFKPEHERNLGNEFSAFSNFNLDNFL